ncbi:MAG: hypothetical protein ABR602_06510 [Gemmatimonadales bacterium]
MSRLLVCAAALLGACDDSGSSRELAASTGRLGATLVSEVVLEESDTAFIGSPGTDFVVAPDGMLYVPDRATDRVYGYQPDGTLVTVIGRRGNGPGELRGVGIALAANDSLLAVPGYQNFRVSLFDRFTGEYRGAARYAHFLSSMKWDGPRLWFGTPERSTNRTVGWIDLASVLGADTIPVIEGAIVPLPVEYTRYPGLIVFDDVLVLPMGDSLLVGTGGMNYLVLMTAGGRELRRVDPPKRLRRGVRGEVLNQYFRTRTTPAAVTFAAISNLAGMWRLPDGSVVLYHRDLEEDNPASRNSQTVGKAYLTVLAPTLDRACADAELPYREPIYPRVTIHADTVFQLDQVLAEKEPGRVRTVVRKYVLDSSGCGW